MRPHEYNAASCVVSLVVSLSATLDSLEGVVLCPEGAVSLVCRAEDLNTDAIRWFLCSEGQSCGIDSVYAVRPFMSGNTQFEVLTPIPGITVTLDSESRNSEHSAISFVSTLTVNLTVYDTGDRPVPVFRCGNFATMSNAVPLNFRIGGGS